LAIDAGREKSFLPCPLTFFHSHRKIADSQHRRDAGRGCQLRAATASLCVSRSVIGDDTGQ